MKGAVIYRGKNYFTFLKKYLIRLKMFKKIIIG